MALSNKLIVSASPHFKSPDTTAKIMLNVIIAMIPAAGASVYFFGPRVLAVLATTVLCCVICEYISQKIMKKPTSIDDLSAVVTGILLAFNLPSTIPLWMAAIGSIVAIVVVKQFFGGLGQNFVNPALVGRIVMMVSFPAQMSAFPLPGQWRGTADAITSATPLAQIGEMFTDGNFSDASLPSLLDMFLGNRQGSLGEVCAIALIAGGMYLIIRKIISPAIPLTYIGTVAVLMLIFSGGDLTFTIYQLLGGGLILGAFFMATDYTTSPLTIKGKIIFALGCAVITCVIRLFGSMAEGVSYSIVLMNILVPHIERLTAPKPFGTEKEKEDAA